MKKPVEIKTRRKARFVMSDDVAQCVFALWTRFTVLEEDLDVRDFYFKYGYIINEAERRGQYE
jgi:hypothetical protein